jgi:hypothetical protein
MLQGIIKRSTYDSMAIFDKGAINILASSAYSNTAVSSPMPNTRSSLGDTPIDLGLAALGK